MGSDLKYDEIMSEIKHARIENLKSRHKYEYSSSGENEYYKRDFVPRGYANYCMVSIYEIPPLKAAHSYHFHYKNEETLYIISGKGSLKTPTGEKKVIAGDFLFFPANKNGAHKLINISRTEKLVYINFSTTHDKDVVAYTDLPHIR